jgi:hypothetical protein
MAVGAGAPRSAIVISNSSSIVMLFPASTSPS